MRLLGFGFASACLNVICIFPAPSAPAIGVRGSANVFTALLGSSAIPGVRKNLDQLFRIAAQCARAAACWRARERGWSADCARAAATLVGKFEVKGRHRSVTMEARKSDCKRKEGKMRKFL